MLPKHCRLTRREDFALVFNKGAYIAISEGIAIKFIQTNASVTRIGFPIGKNFSKKAVERNRVKRILRAAARPLIKNIKAGHDIIVLVKPGRKNLDYQETVKEFNKIFAKANLFI